MFNLQNKVALVTGARSGMGRTHVLALSGQGAKVVIADIDLAQCEIVADEVRANGGDVAGATLYVDGGWLAA